MSVLRSFPKDTACGPSGLRIQHLIDAAEVHLPISICSSLRAVVNSLASGKASMPISWYLAGGSLTALIKNKEDLHMDICPIAVGKAMRRLTGKCPVSSQKTKQLNFLIHFSLVWHVLQELKRYYMECADVFKITGIMMSFFCVKLT